jgi:hypothetical protein
VCVFVVFVVVVDVVVLSLCYLKRRQNENERVKEEISQTRKHTYRQI